MKNSFCKQVPTKQNYFLIVFLNDNFLFYDSILAWIV